MWDYDIAKGGVDYLIYQGTGLLGDVKEFFNPATTAPQVILGVTPEPISDQYPAISPGTYTVNAGDSFGNVLAGESAGKSRMEELRRHDVP